MSQTNRKNFLSHQEIISELFVQFLQVVGLGSLTLERTLSLVGLSFSVNLIKNSLIETHRLTTKNE